MERRETRATAPMQIRAEDAGDGLMLRGYATTFDSEYEITDALGTYVERVAPGAFTRTLEHGADVRLLINHDGLPLARTKSGTLALDQDDAGLLCEAHLDGESPLVRSLKSAMDRGDADQMSFAFRVTRQDWNADYTDRTIRECQLFDVSVVTYPANPATSVSLRTAASLRGLDLDALAPEYGYDIDTETVRQMLRGEAPSAPADLTWQRLRAAALSL